MNEIRKVKELIKGHYALDEKTGRLMHVNAWIGGNWITVYATNSPSSAEYHTYHSFNILR